MSNNLDGYCDSRKIVIIGDSGVGKTSLMRILMGGQFQMDFTPTIGADYASKRMEVDGKVVKVDVWDTAGQERYRCVTKCYYRTASAAIIVYDVNVRQSFSAVNNWITTVHDLTDLKIPIVLVGNKIDVGEEAREVSESEGRNYAEDHKLVFLETSARTGFNVSEAFTSAVRTSMQHTPPQQHAVYSATTETVQLSQPWTPNQRRLPQCRCT